MIMTKLDFEKIKKIMNKPMGNSANQCTCSHCNCKSVRHINGNKANYKTAYLQPSRA